MYLGRHLVMLYLYQGKTIIGHIGIIIDVYIYLPNEHINNIIHRDNTAKNCDLSVACKMIE